MRECVIRAIRILTLFAFSLTHMRARLVICVDLPWLLGAVGSLAGWQPAVHAGVYMPRK